MITQHGGKNICSNSIFCETQKATKKYNLKPKCSIDFESEDEAYNIIICTKKLSCILWKSRDGSSNIKQPFLSYLGLIVTDVIYEVATKFNTCKVEKYAVMPNHVHVLLTIIRKSASLEPLQDVNIVPVYIKSLSESLSGTVIWNDDHKCSRIKTRAEYDNLWLHTARNMLNWESDCYFRL